jgi:hypothetical protein
MKAIRCELLGLVMALAIGLPSAVHAADTPSVSDPSVCIDGMETVPGDDEQEPILAAMDGGCTAPQGPISV